MLHFFMIDAPTRWMPPRAEQRRDWLGAGGVDTHCHRLDILPVETNDEKKKKKKKRGKKTKFLRATVESSVSHLEWWDTDSKTTLCRSHSQKFTRRSPRSEGRSRPSTRTAEMRRDCTGQITEMNEWLELLQLHPEGGTHTVRFCILFVIVCGSI